LAPESPKKNRARNGAENCSKHGLKIVKPWSKNSAHMIQQWSKNAAHMVQNGLKNIQKLIFTLFYRQI
jgi:hypothetical protein